LLIRVVAFDGPDFYESRLDATRQTRRANLQQKRAGGGPASPKSKTDKATRQAQRLRDKEVIQGQRDHLTKFLEMDAAGQNLKAGEHVSNDGELAAYLAKAFLSEPDYRGPREHLFGALPPLGTCYGALFVTAVYMVLNSSSNHPLTVSHRSRFSSTLAIVAPDALRTS
jgi:hypothetical protein